MLQYPLLANIYPSPLAMLPVLQSAASTQLRLYPRCPLEWLGTDISESAIIPYTAGGMSMVGSLDAKVYYSPNRAGFLPLGGWSHQYIYCSPCALHIPQRGVSYGGLYLGQWENQLFLNKVQC